METKVLKISDSEADEEKIGEAAALIEKGALVAFPTETVYGIACRVRKDSLLRLDSIKGRDAGKHYTLHIGEKSDLGRYVPALNMRAEKLVRKAWPGPLTVVFELTDQDIARQRERLGAEVVESLYRDNSVGVRCPDNAVASMLLRLTRGPVVAPSANLSGQNPSVDATQVLAQLSGHIDLLLDGGPCKYKASSTVAKIGKDGLSVLRPGVYSQTDLESLSQVRFLFVCSGNTCRSPMAEGMFRRYLAEKLNCRVDQVEKVGYKVSSAGTMDIFGLAASSEAIAACAAKDVDISGHSSQGLTRELIEGSDVIFCMTRYHCERVMALCPEAAGRCSLLAGDREIPDPIGQSQEVFNSCAEVIERAVRKRIGELVI